MTALALAVQDVYDGDAGDGLDFGRYAPARPVALRSALNAPIIATHDADLSAWTLAMACFLMGWTVLWLSWRHWLAMLGLRIRIKATRVLHSLRTAYFAAAFGWGGFLAVSAILIWR